MVLSLYSRWLQLLLVFVCLSGSLLAANPTSSNSACPYEPLPDSLNTLGALGFNGELHLHNEYYTPYVRGNNKVITINVSEASAIRVYVEPHYIDIDIWLYQGTTRVASTSDYSLADEVIYTNVNPGQYILKFYFFGTFTGECPTMMMELSIIPTARLNARLNSYVCPSKQLLPDLNMQSMNASGFAYDSTINNVGLNVQGVANTSKFAFLQSYKIVLPTIDLYNDAWEIEANLGFHFPTTTLGLLLIDSALPNPTNLSCYDAGNCSLATHIGRGQSTLKALLTPGTYILWLYDVPGERAATPCSPFTFDIKVTHSIQPEDFLNCPGEPFPTDLNVPGLLDSDGYMYFRKQVLVNLERPTNQFTFTVTQDSYIRAYTVAHRIDVDLKLLNAAGTALAYGFKFGSVEEGIQYKLTPGNYTFQLIFYGKYGEVFCESVMTEIAIAPVSLFVNNDVCSKQQQNDPDISGLAALNTTKTYKLANANYRFIYPGDYAKRTIVSQTFNLTVASYIQAQLGANFLLGDVRVVLETVKVGNYPVTSYLGMHFRNVHYLDVLVPAGAYTLSITTGDVQSTPVAGFPTCTTYSLSITVNPESSLGTQQCLKNRPLPTTFNTPQGLNTSPKIHIQEDFLVPNITSLYVQEKITFNVTTKSLFRAYTEPHHIDIDLKLYVNNTVGLVSSVSFNDEEALQWSVLPGLQYTFVVTYYKWFFVDHGDDPCYTYQAEISITPVTSMGATGGCAVTKLPPTALGGLAPNKPIDIDDVYSFNQTKSSNDHKITFTLASPALFRALIEYDFLWNDLALRLEGARFSDDIYGDLLYNQNEIGPLQLAAGSYVLHIYEPFETSTGSMTLRNCVQFHLRLAIETITDEGADPLLLSCPDQYLPTTWNAPGFLSSLSGGNYIFDRNILADVVSRVEEVKFTLTDVSVFRMYVPTHAVLDVDVTLSKDKSTVVSVISFGKEEAIELVLQPANYALKFVYYGLQSTSVLPPPSACTSFRTQVEIFNYTAIAIPSVTTPCTTDFNFNIAPTSAPTTLNFKRSLAVPSFITGSNFTIKSTHLFTAVFDQVDAISGIAMLLTSKNLTKTYNPLYFYNQIYMNEYIPAGTYEFAFHDPTTTASNFSCAPYSLTYSLVPSDVPIDTCDDMEQLPKNLTSTDGGSVPFGGPQQANGFIHMVGTKFLMNKGVANQHNYITFMAYTKSYVRIFIDVDNKNVITASLYSSTNATAANLMDSVVAINAGARSAVWTLPAKATPYVLDLQFTTIDNTLDCNYFTFQFVLEPESVALSGLTCPNPMPAEVDQLPPKTITAFASQDFHLAQDYFITSTKYQTAPPGSPFNYSIAINLAAATLVTVELTYDFIINDFSISLENSGGHVISTGFGQQASTTDSDFNYANYLEWQLQYAGLYYLNIIDISPSSWSVTNFCHAFTLELDLLYTAPTARILEVRPSSGTLLDANAPLTIVVVFSSPASVDSPPGYSLQSYLATYRIVTLEAGTKLSKTPSTATFNAASTELTLVFTGLSAANYTLHLNNTAFLAGNAPFQEGALSTNHTYNMIKCSDCNGHGDCVNGVCVCNSNWTGANCDKCAPGFHAAATQCVPNVKCTTGYCAHNGTCSDAAGYPVCVCKKGYVGATCDDGCAFGYTGFPNCVIDTNTDEETEGLCNAPLLPTTLNSPGYLGYNGHMHLHGFYYINQKARTHEVTFTLTQTSVFRIYSEPHAVDIDLWLFKIGVDGEQTQVGYEISFSLEETMYLVLDAADYMMRFNYYMWSVPPSSCETFNLEWAIASVDTVRTEATGLSNLCGAEKFPPNTKQVFSQPYSFSGTGYNVKSIKPYNSAANYFYRFDFVIAPSSTSQIASFHATIGYRFLQGDLSLLLEAVAPNGKPDHCGNTGNNFITSPPPECSYGDNLANQNTVHRFLEAGNYTLWIYEPTKQNPNITDCSPFDFDMTIDFVDDEEDLLNCDIAPIPSNLDISEYADSPGDIHFHDRFLLDGRAMTFTVNKTSLFRLAVASTVKVALTNAATGKSVTSYGDNQNILASLSAGKYMLNFTGTTFKFCPVVDVELALHPTSTINTVTCPRSSVTPTIDFTKLPVIFTPNRTSPAVPTFYTLNTANVPIVARFSFTTTAQAFLDAGVESDFLLGDLRLQLYLSRSQTTPLAVGSHNYNFNRLQMPIAAGSYELRIVLPPGQRVAGIPTCIAYNFAVQLFYPSEAYPSCTGDHLPFSLNTMRFIGYEGETNYHSNDWLIPTVTLFTYHNINITVATDSVFRAYTSPHHVDIDIKLLDANKVVLVSGSNGIGTEESLTYKLKNNTYYTFQLMFYNFAFMGSYSPCETFNMEFAIEPLPLSRPLICPNTGSNWPQLPTNPPMPFVYNSVDSDIDLYYQQTDNQAKFTTQLVFNKRFNLHAELGYDFIVGDLVVSLYSTATKDTYYGVNKINRNTLNLINLAPGNYTLSIYEPSVNLDELLACSEFTFELFVDTFDALIDEDRYLIEYYLPSNLNSIAFMNNASKKVHLANNYFMFDGSGLHENTTVVLTELSTIRIDSAMYESEVASGRIQAPIITFTKPGNVVQLYYGNMLVSVDAGTYNIKFSPPPSFTIEDDLGALVTVELAIDTSINIMNDIALAPPTCNPTTFKNVVIGSDGYFQDGESQAQVSATVLQQNTEIARIPFVLDRYSLVYIQLGFQFLISELEVTLWAANSSLLMHGRIRKNINEIHQGLPAGSYYALIRQHQNQTTNVPAHCGLFSYGIIIQDAANSTIVVDCSALNEVPWQLNSPYGGSAAFGGPISANGFLHMFAEDIHVPFQTSSQINFNITKPSLVSLMIDGFPTGLSTIDFTVSSGRSYTPTQNLIGYYSRLTTYNLTAASYNISINYRRTGSQPSTCRSYDLQIDVAPIDAIQTQLACSVNKIPLQLPDNIQVTASGASSSMDSFFKGWTQNVSGMKRTITFVISSTTYVTASFSYNSLVAGFKLRLLRKNTLGYSEVETGAFKGQTINSGDTTVYQYISSTVFAASYAFEISHPNISAPFGFDDYICVPFTFSYSIGNQVSIANVNPPGATSISAGKDFTITITFSSSPYKKGGSPITSADSLLMTNSFYLATNDGNAYEPVTAVATSAYGQKWIFTFAALKTAGGNYYLRLRGGQLYDKSGNEITLSAQYQYTTAACGAHGNWSEADSRCVCATGYAGELCDGCDYSKSYFVASDNSNICVQSKCNYDTCGCADAPSCRAPMGSCVTNSSSLPHCNCNIRYTGEFCRQCAPGYINFPSCTPDPCPTYTCNSHGNCSAIGNNQAKCTCTTGYSGDHCDTCATGYSGYPNCAFNACINFDCGPGNCSMDINLTPSCKCPTNRQGKHCDACATGYTNFPACTPQSGTCTTFNCNNGTCQTNSANQPQCRCPASFTGTHCESCAPGYVNFPVCSDACDSFNCGPGTCKIKLSGPNGDPYCTCPTGFTGTHCDACAPGYQNYPTCAKVNTPCATFTCNSGTCSDASGTAKCSCPLNFQGTHCESCADGYQNFPNCTSKAHPCDTFTCNSIGTCTLDSKSQPYCLCPTAYHGSHCEYCADGYTDYPTCSPVSLCATCHHGTCNEVTGKCECDDGYSGSDCHERVSGGSSGLGGGQIALIVIGVIVCLVIVAAGVLLYYRKHGGFGSNRAGSRGRYSKLGLGKRLLGFDDEHDNTFQIEEDSDLREL